MAPTQPNYISFTDRGIEVKRKLLDIIDSSNLKPIHKDSFKTRIHNTPPTLYFSLGAIYKEYEKELEKET